MGTALMPQTWEYLSPIDADAVTQMAIDAEMASTCGGTEPRAILRCYRMTPPAVTIGRNQKWRSVIDEAECRRRKWDWARRPTGGGALLHRFELNYAVAASRAVFGEPETATFRTSYERIMKGLHRAVELLGGQPSLSLGRTGIAATSAQSAHGLCEQSLTRFEITVGGKKAVAAAQWHLADSVLQHGTIYLKAPLPTDRFWPVRPGSEPSSSAEATWWDASASAGDSDDAIQKTAAAIREGLAQALDLTWSPIDLSRLGHDRIQARISAWQRQNWNCHR